MASVPSYIKKYLRMKPEVAQIFSDLDEFRDWVRLQSPAIRFDESDLNKNSSPIWQKYMRHQRSIARRTENR